MDRPPASCPDRARRRPAWAGARAEEKKKGGGASYISDHYDHRVHQPLWAGRRGVLTGECGLDVPDEKLRERANQSLPRLRGGLCPDRADLCGGTARRFAANVDFIGRELQRQTDAIVGRPGARCCWAL
jgi:hypothetical protein